MQLNLELAALVIATMATLAEKTVFGIALSKKTRIFTIVTRASIQMQENAA